MTLLEKIGSLNTPVKIDVAAELLGLHPQTLYRWTRQGKLPSVKMGGAVRIDPGQLAEWVKERQLG